MTGETDDSPPPFDKPLTGEDTKQRICGAILHARDPMTAAEIAEQANCSEEAARTHLSFYADQGIVTRHECESVMYERDDEHIRQRRVNELAQQHSTDELQARAVELTEQIEHYRDEFGAESPADVDIAEFDDEDIDYVYIALGNWATLIEERRLHEHAQQSQ
jgi:DNA-binding transcriptional ArsR family regulator